MEQSRIADIVNVLTDMLVDTGMDSFEIFDALSLTDEEADYVGLDWLTDMYRDECRDGEDEEEDNPTMIDAVYEQYLHDKNLPDDDEEE